MSEIITPCDLSLNYCASSKKAYDNLSPKSKIEILKAEKDLIDKGLNIFNGKKEKMMQNLTKHWSMVDNIEKQAYTDILNNVVYGYAISTEKIAKIAGVEANNPCIENIITAAIKRTEKSAAAIAVKSRLACKNNTNKNATKTTDKLNSKKSKTKKMSNLKQKADNIVSYGLYILGTTISGFGLYKLISSNSEIIKNFIKHTAIEASSIINNPSPKTALTILGCGAVLNGIAKHKFKSKTIYTLLRDKLFHREMAST